MTPEETKTHVENRLRELGWSVHIGNAGYEKISRFTGGSEAGVSQICHKLISLGALQDRREITDDVVEMAVLDLGRFGETAPRADRGNGGHDVDWGSIEELAAELETKVGAVGAQLERQLAPQHGYPGNGGVGAAAAAQRKDAARSKILLVDPARESRGRFAKALSNDFSVVEAADGEQAWQTLRGETDIELLVTDLATPKVDGYELIKRLREATSPVNLVGMPIIVLATPENANAKMRVLMAGANDFIAKSTEPAELRGRIVARHRLSKAASRIAVAPSSGAMRNVGYGSARAPATPGASPADIGDARSGAAARAPVATLTAERRYGRGTSTARNTGVPPRDAAGKEGRRSNSTTTITVGATVLLALAIAVIFYLARDNESFRIAPQATVAPQPSPPPITRESEMDAVTPADDTPLATESRPPIEPERPLPPVAKSAPSPEPVLPEAKEQTAQAPRRGKALEAAPELQAPEPAPSARPPEALKSPPPEMSPPRSTTPQLAPVPQAPPATSRAQQARPTTPRAPIPVTPPAQVEAAEVSPNREELARVEPVPPPSAAPKPPQSPPANRISRDELSTFLTRFASIYEAGDLEQFIRLFAENARTNDRNGRGGIRQDYESLFRTTDLRRMKLGEISWDVEENQAQGWGEFDVAVRRRGDRQPYLYTGSLTFVVEKIDGRLRIVRLYHGQRRAES